MQSILRHTEIRKNVSVALMNIVDAYTEGPSRTVTQFLDEVKATFLTSNQFGIKRTFEMIALLNEISASFLEETVRFIFTSNSVPLKTRVKGTLLLTLMNFLTVDLAYAFIGPQSSSYTTLLTIFSVSRAKGPWTVLEGLQDNHRIYQNGVPSEQLVIAESMLRLNEDLEAANVLRSLR